MAQKSILSFFKAPECIVKKSGIKSKSNSSKSSGEESLQKSPVKSNEEQLEKLTEDGELVKNEMDSQESDSRKETNKMSKATVDHTTEKDNKFEVIPKRITARKQIRNTSKLKKDNKKNSKPTNSQQANKSKIETDKTRNEAYLPKNDIVEENLQISESTISDEANECNNIDLKKWKMDNGSVLSDKLAVDIINNNQELPDDCNDTENCTAKKRKNVIVDDSPVKDAKVTRHDEFSVKEKANTHIEPGCTKNKKRKNGNLCDESEEKNNGVTDDNDDVCNKKEIRKKRKKNVIRDDSPVKDFEVNEQQEENVKNKTDIKKVEGSDENQIDNHSGKTDNVKHNDDNSKREIKKRKKSTEESSLKMSDATTIKIDDNVESKDWERLNSVAEVAMQTDRCSSDSKESDDEVIHKIKRRSKSNIITDDIPVKSSSDSHSSSKSTKRRHKKKNAKKSREVTNKLVSETKEEAVHSFFAPKKTLKQPDSVEETSDNKKIAAKTNSLPSTQDKEIYNPAKHHYHPIDDACWRKGEKVPYVALARTLEEVENISARLKMIEILANYFRSVMTLTPEDLLQSVYLCLNRIAPEFEGIELSVGDTILMKALALATGRTVEKIKAEVAVKGDLGSVARSSRGHQRVMFPPPKLTVSSVFSKFKEIALMSGNAVMSKKVDKILALFVACNNCEGTYIIRSLSGKLRIGLAEQSVLAALSQAAVLTPPNQSYPPEIINASSKHSTESFKKILDANTLILKTTYCECPNYDILIPVLLKEGISGLPIHCRLTPGTPLKPMLAHPTKGIEEVLRRFDANEFTCEFKYDGERAQIHVLEDGTKKIYSRNQEDNTTKFPDVLSRLPKALKPETKSCILDTEVVAWDCEANQILPFQVLSTRKRKDAVESEITVQVCVVAFDLLYLNGESLIKKPLKERRELLKNSFIEVPNEFLFVQSTDGNSADIMQVFLEESIKGSCEGLMVKSLEVDATYEIAKRSHNWLKLKKDYLDGVGDTLDLVVIGGFHGKGKRTGNYGGFLLACYDNENEEFQTICKIGTGFKDEDLENHGKFFKEHVITEPKSYFRFDSSLEPDEWFEPAQVWEIKCADLSISPVHKAAIGIVDSEKGISLRFPRFLRIREDKKPEEATTALQVSQMYNSQEQVQNQKQKETKFDDEAFY